MPRLDYAEIARREERRQMRGMAELADAARPFAGGLALRARPGLWLNNIVAAGLDGPVNARELRDIVDWFVAAGCEPRIDVCPFADPTLISSLGELGFTLRGFITILYRELDPRLNAEPVQPGPTGLEIEVVDRTNPERLLRFCRLVAEGFATPENPAREDDIGMWVKCAQNPRVTGVIARLEGRDVGGGSMEIAGDSAAFFGLSVLPAWRRRGVQQALIAHRLNLAARAGCRTAAIGSRPGAPTERNVRRMGFETAYIKAVLVRPTPGTTPLKW